MKILTLSCFLCLFYLGLVAQCVTSITLPLNANTCSAVLTYNNLTVAGNPTTSGPVRISAPGLGTLFTGTLPYQFSSANSVGDKIVDYTTAGGTMCSATIRFSACPASIPIPAITSPTAGAVLDNGCASRSDATNWNFSWTPVTGATDYNLRIFQNGTLRASLSSATNSLNYNRANFFYTAANTTGWTVSVSAIVGGVFSSFSPAVSFSLEAPDTDCPAGFPIITSPSANAVLDNGCTNASDPWFWDFAWTPVIEAASYSIQIVQNGRIIQRQFLRGTSYRYGQTANSYFLNDNLSGLSVSITAYRDNGDLLALSRDVPFSIEPVNTDCPVPCAEPAAPNVSYNSVTNLTNISWATTPGVFGYTVEYRLAGTTSSFTVLNFNAFTSGISFTLDIGTNYEFRMKKRCTSTLTSFPSASAILSIPCPVVPSAPTVTYDNANFSATVSWPSVLGAHKYLMDYRLAGTDDVWKTIETFSTSVTVGNLLAGRDYSFRVRVSCPGFIPGDPSSVGTLDVPCLDIPEGQVLDVTTTSATLRWGTSGADLYKIVSEDGDEVLSSATTITLNDLLPDNTYTYRVVPNCNVGVNSGISLTFTTLPSPVPILCRSPLVNFIKIRPTSAVVSWSKSASVRRYRVEYKLSSETEWKTITTSKTSVTLEGLTARDLGDSKYDVQVSSICSPSSSSEASAMVSFQTKSSCPEVDALAVTYTSFTMGRVVWDEEALATDGFLAEYSLSPFDAANAKTKASLTNTMDVMGLEPNKSYVVRVKSQCGGSAISQFSEPVAFKTDPIVCGAPIKLKTFNITPNSVSVAWGNVPVANNFELAYKKDNDANWTSIMTTNPGIGLSALDAETKYNIRVKSLCPFDNQSVWSAVGSFTTAAVASAPNIIVENNEGSVKNKVAHAFDVSISPNPTKGEIQLDVETDKEQSLDIALTNRLGQVVLRKKFDNIAKGHTTLSLDLTNLPSDIYMVRSFNGQAYKTNKVVIIH
jgi:hypothetical protein